MAIPFLIKNTLNLPERLTMHNECIYGQSDDDQEIVFYRLIADDSDIEKDVEIDVFQDSEKSVKIQKMVSGKVTSTVSVPIDEKRISETLEQLASTYDGFFTQKEFEKLVKDRVSKGFDIDFYFSEINTEGILMIEWELSEHYDDVIINQTDVDDGTYGSLNIEGKGRTVIECNILDRAVLEEVVQSLNNEYDVCEEEAYKRA